MSLTIKFYRKANREYVEAYDWYEEQSEGLGERFENSLLEAVNSIANNPLHYQEKKMSSRECKLHNFPYLVVYRIFPKQNKIYILSIFHTSRNPKRKYRK